MSALAHLRGARARIARPEHWLQESFAQDEHWRIVPWHGVEACRFCGLAALWAAGGRGRDVGDATAILRVAIAPAPSFARWNDELDRTHAEVLAALDRAIAYATRKRVPHPILAGRDLDAVLGLNLRHAREDAGLTVAQLATRTGLYADQVLAAEAGTERLTPVELLAVQTRLGCGWEALFREPRAERRPS